MNINSINFPPEIVDASNADEKIKRYFKEALIGRNMRLNI